MVGEVTTWDDVLTQVNNIIGGEIMSLLQDVSITIGGQGGALAHYRDGVIVLVGSDEIPLEPNSAWGVILLHELGHHLDHVLGRQHMAVPFNDHGRKNRNEAFAEAFYHWVLYGDDGVVDTNTVVLFDSLKAQPHH